jgi:hypothetical protein
MDETWSLEQTVATILGEAADAVSEFLIVVGDRTTPDTLATAAGLIERHPGKVRLHRQTLPFLGGAIREAFRIVHGSHVVMMASDLETDPSRVKIMVEESRRHPDAIVTASRWRSGGSFRGYSPVKLVANRVFQTVFALLYGVRLTDMTFGYRLFPVRLVQAIRWEELRHPFLFETIVKPLRLGVPVIEIPAVWNARGEGRSSNPLARNFAYLRTGLATRFRSPASLLLPAQARRAMEP